MHRSLKPKRSLRWSKIGTEVVIFHRDKGEVLRLNVAAGFIWTQLAAGHLPQDIIARLCEQFKVEPLEAERDVHQLIQQLEDLELLQS